MAEMLTLKKLLKKPFIESINKAEGFHLKNRLKLQKHYQFDSAFVYSSFSMQV